MTATRAYAHLREGAYVCARTPLRAAAKKSIINNILPPDRQTDRDS